VPAVIKYWHRIVNEPQDTLLSNALSVHQHMKHSGEDNICDTISLMISKLGLTATDRVPWEKSCCACMYIISFNKKHYKKTQKHYKNGNNYPLMDLN
jgi:hypothetical protein